MSAIEEVLAGVREKIKPRPEDRENVMRVVDGIKRNIEREAMARGLKVRVEVEGSLAKDTWIATDRDIDLFIIFPRGTPKDALKDVGLQLAKSGA
ncbi:MAG: nucleotidyltransferase domain-containing protein, partial [Candidatus Methanomethylicia archaeon]|nr:nucleotidyltransferase domain-containing protein [Candidatus Methanomethylicia archaeon]